MLPQVKLEPNANLESDATQQSGTTEITNNKLNIKNEEDKQQDYQNKNNDKVNKTYPQLTQAKLKLIISTSTTLTC